ncbi:MAG: N-acetylmuramoyl-L-alanine amidase [Clostridia bacterium]|nr:N-acetylmuramoyl-L-alanine amidase [Clostridia bacterium]
MQNFKMSNVERLILKRRLARKKRTRNLIISLLAIVFAVFCVMGITIYKNNGSFFEKKLNVKTTVVPEYVDVQLINLGFARTGVKLIKIKNIVIHYVGNPGSTAQNNRDFFNKPTTEVSSHFVVGLDGEIVQCLPIDEKSNASNNRNIDTISIEVCHPDSSGKFTDATYNSLLKLTAWLCDNSNLKSKDVIRHYDITGKVCPKYFVDNESKWQKFLEDVNSEITKIKAPA